MSIGHAEVLRISAHCVDLEGKREDGTTFDSDRAVFLISEGDEDFVSGPAAWAQGEFYGADAAATPITCDVGGEMVSLRLANYRIENGFERFQVELWLNDRLAYRSGPVPRTEGLPQDLWDQAFSGVIEYDGVTVRVCQAVITGQGHRGVIPTGDEKPMTQEELLAALKTEAAAPEDQQAEAEMERARLAFEASNLPSEHFYNLQGQIRCG